MIKNDIEDVPSTPVASRTTPAVCPTPSSSLPGIVDVLKYSQSDVEKMKEELMRIHEGNVEEKLKPLTQQVSIYFHVNASRPPKTCEFTAPAPFNRV